MSNGPCRAMPQIGGPLRAVMPSRPCLYGLRAWPSPQGTARGPVFVPCQPVKHAVSCQPTAHQTDNSSFSFHHFHQLFIIFTNITINNTYIQVITTRTVHVHPGRYHADRWNGSCPGRVACLGDGPGTAWSLKPGRPGPSGHHAVSCSGRAKSPSYGPGHQAAGHMAMYDAHSSL